MSTTAASPVLSPPSSGTEGCTSTFSGTVPAIVSPVLISAVSMSIFASRSHSSGKSKGETLKEVPAVARSKKHHECASSRASVNICKATAGIVVPPAAVAGAPPRPGSSPSFKPNEGLPITNTLLSFGTLSEESDLTGVCVE